MVMTEKDKYIENVSEEDEKLIASFFSDCSLSVEDDGFSDRVMAALPQCEMQGIGGESVARTRRLEWLWTAVCVVAAVAFVAIGPGWEGMQDMLYVWTTNGMVHVAHVATELLRHDAQIGRVVLMGFVGLLILAGVYVYNKLQEDEDSCSLIHL